MQAQGIKSIKKLGIQSSLDFKVNHKDHNFYAEGIVVSNSHSLATSYLTALTVYLKYKYPKEFYLACLNEAKEKTKHTESIAQIQKELRHFNISLLPPHILRSDIDFKIVGNDIMFGLGSIKGINNETIEKLNKFRHPHSNKFEIFTGAKEAGLSIGVLGALVLCGSLGNEKRSKLLYEAQLFNLLTINEKRLIIELGPRCNFDLVQCLRYLRTLKNERGKPILKDSRYETIKKHEIPYKKMFEFNSKHENLMQWWAEKTLLGYSYSIKLIDIYKDVAPDLITIEEINSSLEGERVHCIGEVIKVVNRKGKESGQKYLRVEVQDHTGSCQVLLCNTEKYDKVGEHIEDNQRAVEEGDIVVVNGSKGKDIIFANKIGVQEKLLIMKASEIKEEKELN